jgi:hypothetical protein
MSALAISRPLRAEQLVASVKLLKSEMRRSFGDARDYARENSSAVLQIETTQRFQGRDNDRDRPLGSRVAVCSARAVVMLPVGLNVPIDGALIVKFAAFDIPPIGAGSVTVTVALPAEAMAAAGIAAVNCGANERSGDCSSAKVDHRRRQEICPIDGKGER